MLTADIQHNKKGEVKMRKVAFIILTLTIFLAACADPAADKPKAETKDPTAKSTEKTGKTKSEPKGTALKISPENSKIEFTGSKVTRKHEGGFKQFSGVIDMVNEKPEESSVSVEIDMKSVFADPDKLAKHLRTADFFDVEKFPKSTFSSTGIVADEKKGDGNYIVTGDFELRGVKKSISFPAKIVLDKSDLIVDAEFSINRKDFEIKYAGMADDLIRDNVVIRLKFKSPIKK